MRTLILSALLLLGFAACVKEEKEDPAQETSWCRIYRTPSNVGFNGFDSAELSTVLLRKYVPNGMYDSLLSDSSVQLAVINGSDTARMANGVTAYIHGLYGGYAYEVEIPAAGRTYRIDGFYYAGATGYYSSACPPSADIDGSDTAVVDSARMLMQQAFGGNVGCVYLQE